MSERQSIMRLIPLERLLQLQWMLVLMLLVVFPLALLVFMLGPL